MTLFNKERKTQHKTITDGNPELDSISTPNKYSHFWLTAVIELIMSLHPILQAFLQQLLRKHTKQMWQTIRWVHFLQWPETGNKCRKKAKNAQNCSDRRTLQRAINASQLPTIQNTVTKPYCVRVWLSGLQNRVTSSSEEVHRNFNWLLSKDYLYRKTLPKLLCFHLGKEKWGRGMQKCYSKQKSNHFSFLLSSLQMWQIHSNHQWNLAHQTTFKLWSKCLKAMGKSTRW